MDRIVRVLVAAIVNQLVEEDLDEEAFVLNVVLHNARLQRRLLERRQVTRVEGYVERIIPRYNNLEFQSHFRMERTSFEQLVQLLGPHLSTRCVSIEKKLLSTVWVLGNKESFRGVADRFDLNKGFLHGIFLEVCDALKAVRHQFISWPNRQEATRIASQFLHKTGFPGVVGCIDGTHIPIPGPSQSRASYINQKGYPSVQLQAVCDDRLRFIDINVGWPGSVHDARVYRNSPLCAYIEGGNLPEDLHLLGDSAYDLSQNMMVPYRDNGHLNEIQVNFNSRHSSTRVAIERAFGLLKSKFRRMQNLEMRSVAKTPLVISAACVLHNFILENEKVDVDFEIGELEFQNQELVELHDPQPPNVRARNKRDTLADLLF